MAGQVAATFAEIHKQADLAAQAIAADAQAKKDATGAAEGLTASLEQQSKVQDELAKLATQLERVGLSDTEIKLADLADLGATNEQLEQARLTLERIKQAQAKQERGTQISGTIDDLERQVRLFGLSDTEKTLLDLESLGASADELERAKAAMAELDKLQKEQQQPQALNHILADSAEAQRLAFQAARDMANVKVQPIVDMSVPDMDVWRYYADLDDETEQVVQQLERISEADPTIALADPAHLTAVNQQLDQARQTLEQMQAPALSFIPLVGDIDTSKLELGQTIQLGIELLQPAADQVARLRASIANLLQLSAPATPALSMNTVASNAEVRRVSTTTAQAMARNDETPRKQLQTQQKMVSLLEQIERQGGANNNLTVQEWGI